MQHDTWWPGLPELYDHTDEDDFGVDADVEPPRRVTPALAKAIAYKRDRRFVGEDPHSARKGWPRAKQIRRQRHRRQADRALFPVLGVVSPDLDELAVELPPLPKAERPWRHANIPLGEWVDQKLEKRFSAVGSNIGVKIRRETYRRRLIPFLESLVVGKRGYSVELARRFDAVLRGLARGRMHRLDDLPFVMHWRGPYSWNRALLDLFDEQPEWETRLRAWIAEVAPSAPPAEEPAWKRIRRLKARTKR